MSFDCGRDPERSRFMVVEFAEYHYEEEGREHDDIIEGACTLLVT